MNRHPRPGVPYGAQRVYVQPGPLLSLYSLSNSWAIYEEPTQLLRERHAWGSR